MTVIDVDFATRERSTAPLTRTRSVPTDASRWHCPTWCTHDEGGDTLTAPTGVDLVMIREHYNVTFDRTVDDAGGGTADVKVEVIAFEDATDGYYETPTVVIDAGRLTADLDVAEEFAHAVLAAVAFARQPLPATDTRSPSYGGDWASNPREAS